MLVQLIPAPPDVPHYLAGLLASDGEGHFEATIYVDRVDLNDAASYLDWCVLKSTWKRRRWFRGGR